MTDQKENTMNKENLKLLEAYYSKAEAYSIKRIKAAESNKAARKLTQNWYDLSAQIRLAIFCVKHDKNNKIVEEMLEFAELYR